MTLLIERMSRWRIYIEESCFLVVYAFLSAAVCRSLQSDAEGIGLLYTTLLSVSNGAFAFAPPIILGVISYVRRSTVTCPVLSIRILCALGQAAIVGVAQSGVVIVFFEVPRHLWLLPAFFLFGRSIGISCEELLRRGKIYLGLLGIVVGLTTYIGVALHTYSYITKFLLL